MACFRRNKLISGDDVQRLAQWIKMISWAAFFLIERSQEAAFNEYKQSSRGLLLPPA